MTLYKCPNCELDFKYHKSRDNHKQICIVYGGPIDKRRKNEYTKACEASEKIDGTLIHASGIFHALLALPKEQRKNITIDNVDNTVVITQLADENVVGDEDGVIRAAAGSKVVNNYNLQITNNTQNIQNFNNFTQETLNQLCERSNTIRQSGDDDLLEVIESLHNENFDTPLKIQNLIKKVLTFDEVQDTIENKEDDTVVGDLMKKFIEGILLSTTNTIEEVDDQGNPIVVNEIKHSPSDCIWLFYRKVFLSEQPNGKINTNQLARRNTNLQANGNCKVLAFKKINGNQNIEHAVWDNRKWKTVLKTLLIKIGDRIATVFKTANLSQNNQCHSFGDWWNCIKSADDLEKDKYAIQLIKKITNATVLDGKEGLISGWYKLIDACGQIHFDTISTTLVGLKALETDVQTLSIEEEVKLMRKQRNEYAQTPEYKKSQLFPEEMIEKETKIDDLMTKKIEQQDKEREEIIEYGLLRDAQ